MNQVSQASRQAGNEDDDEVEDTSELGEIDENFDPQNIDETKYVDVDHKERRLNGVPEGMWLMSKVISFFYGAGSYQDYEMWERGKLQGTDAASKLSPSTSSVWAKVGEIVTTLVPPHLLINYNRAGELLQMIRERTLTLEDARPRLVMFPELREVLFVTGLSTVSVTFLKYVCDRVRGLCDTMRVLQTNSPSLFDVPLKISHLEYLSFIPTKNETGSGNFVYGPWPDVQGFGVTGTKHSDLDTKTEDGCKKRYKRGEKPYTGNSSQLYCKIFFFFEN